ncbi:MAG: hypothetical protein A2X99_07075 [Deltaproteobacteria bacterium GWB2_55_19]|nr:MAG: hypothetical protein A2X99_07075 [Deltaproteobacteria bacterium GWB2_55_19]
MIDIEEFVHKLLSDLSALPEERMRLDLLGRRLSHLSPEDSARAIDLIYKMGPPAVHAKKAASLLVDPEGLKTALGPERYRLIYLAAIGLGLGKVSRLFTDLPPLKKGLSGYETEEEAPMELLSLGERRALSKKQAKDVIDRLLSDPDPMVIGNILNNPRTTEKEVLKVASKRPNSPAILKLVVAHGKWSKRYDVKKAVALNPYTPPRVTVALLESLMTQDLRAIAEDQTIHPQAREAAKDIVKERDRGRV